MAGRPTTATLSAAARWGASHRLISIPKNCKRTRSEGNTHTRAHKEGKHMSRCVRANCSRSAGDCCPSRTRLCARRFIVAPFPRVNASLLSGRIYFITVKPIYAQQYVMCTDLSSLPDKASVVVCRKDNEGIPVADEPGPVCRTAGGEIRERRDARLAPSSAAPDEQCLADRQRPPSSFTTDAAAPSRTSTHAVAA